MGVPVLISDHSMKNNCIKLLDGSNFVRLSGRDLSSSSRGRAFSSTAPNPDNVGDSQQEAPRNWLSQQKGDVQCHSNSDRGAVRMWILPRS